VRYRDFTVLYCLKTTCSCMRLVTSLSVMVRICSQICTLIVGEDDTLFGAKGHMEDEELGYSKG
ncbi:hypothetical protein HAX54_031580, partial [Datura stramonium]|nr:hypothetical protein [Datura stramonium]